MPNIQVQFRRGTTSQHSSFTGATGEVTVDTDLDTLRVHDGSTAGGVRLAKYSELSSGSPSQTWSDETSSRAFGTTYTNSTGNTISVHARIYASGNQSAPGISLQVNTGTSGSPVWLTISYLNESLVLDDSRTLVGLIPDGIEYRVTVTNTTNINLTSWLELR